MHYNLPHHTLTVTILFIRSNKQKPFYPQVLSRISVFHCKMCKFNQLLPLLVCCAQLIQISVTSPLGTLLFDDYIDEQTDGDYDLHYDERQNGTENYRLNINGVVIAVPGASSNAMSSIGLLASNYLLELAEAAAANDESNGDQGVDEIENDDDHPYDFEIPTGSQENNDDKIENAEPVVVISADSITKPTENESAPQDLKPENNVDAVNEKESTTNKKDLNVEIVKVTDNLKLTSEKPIVEVVQKDKESVTPGTRQVSSKVANKRKKQ